MTLQIKAGGSAKYAYDVYLKNTFGAVYVTQPTDFTTVPAGQVLICILTEPGQFYQIALRVDSQQELNELIVDTLNTNIAQPKTWMTLPATAVLPTSISPGPAYNSLITPASY